MKLHLMKGDCLEVLKSIDTGTVDLIVTDPPYGINYKSNKQLGNTRSGHTETTREGHYFDAIKGDSVLPTAWLPEAYRVLKNDSAIYVFCRWDKWPELFSVVIGSGFKPKNMIVMNKSNHGMGDLKGAYANKHELVMYAVKGRHLLRMPRGRPKDIIDAPVKYSGAKRLHPNEKPVSWLTGFIEESSDEAGVVLDPFMGSGSTGEAALNLSRSFVGVEVEDSYYSIASERLAQFEVLK